MNHWKVSPITTSIVTAAEHYLSAASYAGAAVNKQRSGDQKPTGSWGWFFL